MNKNALKFYIIVDSTKLTTDGLMPGFEDRPFGFMQHPKCHMNGDDIHKAINLFYDEIYTSLGFVPSPDKDGILSWSFDSVNDERIIVEPRDRFLVDTATMSIFVEFAEGAADEHRKVFYGEAKQRFANFSNLLIRETLGTQPNRLTKRKYMEYTNGMPASEVKAFYINKFKAEGYMVYEDRSDLIIYSKYDDKTHAEITMNRMRENRV